MKMVVRQVETARPDDPVELWLELGGDGVYVKARKGPYGDGTHLLHIDKHEIAMCDDVDSSVGFDLYDGKMRVRL